jgi:hypothetical protein
MNDMEWKLFPDEKPKDGQLVLTAKTFFGEGGIVSPVYTLDSGNSMNDGFKWQRGGITYAWMEIPPAPKWEKKDKNDQVTLYDEHLSIKQPSNKRKKYARLQKL